MMAVKGYRINDTEFFFDFMLNYNCAISRQTLGLSFIKNILKAVLTIGPTLHICLHLNDIQLYLMHRQVKHCRCHYKGSYRDI